MWNLSRAILYCHAGHVAAVLACLVRAHTCIACSVGMIGRSSRTRCFFRNPSNESDTHSSHCDGRRFGCSSWHCSILSIQLPDSRNTGTISSLLVCNSYLHGDVAQQRRHVASPQVFLLIPRQAPPIVDTSRDRQPLHTPSDNRGQIEEVKECRAQRGHNA